MELEQVGRRLFRLYRRKLGGSLVVWKSLFLVTLFLFLFAEYTPTTKRLFFQEKFRPKLVSSWGNQAMKAIFDDSPAETPVVTIRHTVVFPEQALVFLKYPPSTPLFSKDDFNCVYYPLNSTQSTPQLELPPVAVDNDYLGHQIVRCTLEPRGSTASVALKSRGEVRGGPTYRWDSLAYEAMIDHDNSTVVFVKGFNLRSEKLSDPSKYECVYGWDLRRPKHCLRSRVRSISQEIVRCETPLSVLRDPKRISNNDTIRVSVRRFGGPMLDSIARPEKRLEPAPSSSKPHAMCVCTILRNQARFLKEWVMYHAKVGVQRWFLYDNNSDDDIVGVIEPLVAANFNITRHVWPWIKAQESGFAHCALRARDSCEWIGFIDVDEFFYSPSGLSLHDVLGNKSRPKEVAELRSMCYNFGPSGLKKSPAQGVTVGYACRMALPERHKSIVRPDALNSTLINLVHHFHLKDGFEHYNVDKNVMAVNHYKYQVWDVFKEKFYRRVSTYVADWQQEQNVGSKDRAPGLGTKAVEPPDWPTRFCEVKDTGLKDHVLKTFADPITGKLPWQEEEIIGDGPSVEAKQEA